MCSTKCDCIYDFVVCAYNWNPNKYKILCHIIYAFDVVIKFTGEYSNNKDDDDTVYKV